MTSILGMKHEGIAKANLFVYKLNMVNYHIHYKSKIKTSEYSSWSYPYQGRERDRALDKSTNYIVHLGPYQVSCDSYYTSIYIVPLERKAWAKGNTTFYGKGRCQSRSPLCIVYRSTRLFLRTFENRIHKPYKRSYLLHVIFPWDDQPYVFSLLYWNSHLWI